MRSLSKVETVYYGRAVVQATVRINPELLTPSLLGSRVLVTPLPRQTDIVYSSGSSIIVTPAITDDDDRQDGRILRYEPDPEFPLHGRHISVEPSGESESRQLAALTQTLPATVAGVAPWAPTTPQDRVVHPPQLRAFAANAAVGHDWFDPFWLNSYLQSTPPSDFEPLKFCRVSFRGWDFDQMPFWYSCMVLLQSMMSALYTPDRRESLRAWVNNTSERSSIIFPGAPYMDTASPILFSRTPDTLSVYINFHALTLRGMTLPLFRSIGVDEFTGEILARASYNELDIGDEDNARSIAEMFLRCADEPQGMTRQRLYLETLMGYIR